VEQPVSMEQSYSYCFAVAGPRWYQPQRGQLEPASTVLFSYPFPFLTDASFERTKDDEARPIETRISPGDGIMPLLLLLGNNKGEA
jgi:hypothetical protein